MNLNELYILMTNLLQWSVNLIGTTPIQDLPTHIHKESMIMPRRLLSYATPMIVSYRNIITCAVYIETNIHSVINNPTIQIPSAWIWFYTCPETSTKLQKMYKSETFWMLLHDEWAFHTRVSQYDFIYDSKGNRMVDHIQIYYILRT